jgi:putative holliday junction resolvase
MHELTHEIWIEPVATDDDECLMVLWRRGTRAAVECLRKDAIITSVRAMGIDLGERRIGVAISDATGTLARPLKTLEIANADDGLRRVVAEITRLLEEDDSLSTIVVGLPVRLDGSPNAQTSRVTAFVSALRQSTPVPIVTIDERLSSVEAESRMAMNTRDWRERKKKLDAAAAAVILQDYLDTHA